MYRIYELYFDTAVHFGESSLENSAESFCADTFFSALCIEAVKADKLKTLYEMVDGNRLLFSDAFPFKKGRYYLPKPMLRIASDHQGDSTMKKKYKKLAYVAADMMEDYLRGKLDFEKNDSIELGYHTMNVRASVRGNVETKPYQVGIFNFNKECGLYLIVKCEGQEEELEFEQLLEAVSYTGIGGKRSTGLGKFHYLRRKLPKDLESSLESDCEKKMLLCTALPTDEELERVLDHSSYMLKKRTGYVYSDQYADEFRKKKDMYAFSAGSVFEHSFDGDIYDVSRGGRHPVYRYAKGFFVGLEGV